MVHAWRLCMPLQHYSADSQGCRLQSHEYGVDACCTSASDCDPLRLSFCCSETGYNPLKVLSSVRERWSICWLVAAAGVHERRPASITTHEPLRDDAIF